MLIFFLYPLPATLYPSQILVQSTSSVKGGIAEKKKAGVQGKIMEWQDQTGGLAEGGYFVVRDSESWKNLWIRIRQDDPPEIDFKKKMVLAAFLGVKPTGGYTIRIGELEKRKGKILVFVKTAKPPRGAFVIQALTSPYCIKVVNRSDLPVEFKSQ